MTTVIEEPVEERKPRSRLLVVSLIGALVVIAGLWGYAIWYSVAGPNPEKITTTEANRVEKACVDAYKQHQALPTVKAPPTNASVAARAKAETDVYASMLATLRTVHPKQKGGATAYAGWLSDWDRIIAARQAYEADVHPGAEIVFPLEKGQPISIRMNNFAESHGFQACTTSALGAENVTGVR